MTTTPRSTLLKLALASSLIALVAACGGGSGGDPTLAAATPPPPGPTPAPAPTPAPSAGSQTWQAPVKIPTAVNAVDLQLDLAANGNAVAVWREDENNVSSIWASTYTPAVGWAAAKLLETSNLGSAAFAQVKWDAAGNAMAIWQQYDGTYTSIYSARFTPAGDWAAAELVENLPIPNAGIPQIAFDPAGSATAVWVGQDVGSRQYSAWSNRYTPSTGWGTPELLESDESGDVGRIQVVVDADGNAFAVWDQSINNQRRIQANRFSPAGGWAGATVIEDNADGNARDVQVAVDATGHAVAVWSRNNNGPISTVQANRYVPGSGWNAAHISVTTDGQSQQPQLAMDPAGNAVVVWSQITSNRANVWASSYSPTTGSFAVPVLLENEDIYDALEPQVSMDAQGNAIAVWLQTTALQNNLWQAQYTLAGGWAAASLVETEDTAAALDPTVHVAPNGTAVIGWRYFAPGGNTLWTRFFQ
jgi:hypothetical protein